MAFQSGWAFTEGVGSVYDDVETCPCKQVVLFAEEQRKESHFTPSGFRV